MIQNINWYPGHMKKTRELIQENLKAVDLVIELLDSRIPISSRNPIIDELVGDKRRIVLLGKSDLADSEETEKWQRYFSRKGDKTLAIDARSGENINRLFSILDDVQREKNQQRQMNRSIRMMVVGVPNVGKSTIINQLHGGAIAQVGNRPGVTRANQWVRVGEYLEVLDTPGLLWPKLDDPVAARRLAYISAIRDEVVDTFALSCALLEDMTALAPEALTARYKITDMSLRGQALLEAVCRGRGFLLRGGELDIERASAVVLDEFRDGKLGRLTLEAPPETAEKAPVKENNDDAQ